MNYNFIETENSEIFFIDELVDDIGIRNLRKFLQEIILNFSNESFSFYKIWGEFPFIYSEKQVHSILTPSIHKYTDNIWVEQPFKDYKKNQRFLDIATTHKDNIYLIELKHSWNSKTNQINKRCNLEWENAINQINDINRKTINGYFNYKNYNVFKIALMIMPTYLSVEENHDILQLNSREYCEMIFDDFNNLSEKLKSNFNATIKIKNPSRYKHEFINGNQIYPYITFIAKILNV